MRNSGYKWVWASSIVIACAAFSLLSELGASEWGGPPAGTGGPEDAGIHDALLTLDQDPSGHELLLRAERRLKLKQTRDLAKLFHWGSVSRTDAVLTRHFDPVSGAESQEREIAIYLKKGQSQPELVLDLAHELTHAGSGSAWDPYDPNLDASSYVWNAIEGDGGEVDALTTECKIGRAIQATSAIASSRCAAYGDSVDRDLVRGEFYRVGRWHSELLKRLEVARFPLLSELDPKLYSSTGHAPYPAALLQEYEELTEIACENSRKRAQASGDRTPASAREFMRRRCSEQR